MIEPDEIDTGGMSDSEVAIHAALVVHMALLSALVATHADKQALMGKFQALISDVRERVTDSRFSETMTTLENAFQQSQGG